MFSYFSITFKNKTSQGREVYTVVKDVMILYLNVTFWEWAREYSGLDG